MWETIILTTFLLLLFLGLRHIVDGKISARFQYALWIIVAARLLFAWIPLPASSISILPFVNESVESITQLAKDVSNANSADGDSQRGNENDITTITDIEKSVEGETLDSNLSDDGGLADNGSVADSQKQTQAIESQLTVPVEGDGAAGQLSVKGNKDSSDSNTVKDIDSKKSKTVDLSVYTKLFTGIYFAGVCLMFLAIVLRNIMFFGRIKKMRICYEGELPGKNIPGKVFLLDKTSSPFLFGKNIYIAPEMLQDENSLRYCLLHETCHYKQGDMLWSIVRNLCLVMYWYHPLVWLCVSLSDNDAELACDERTIALLGEEHRLDYGKALLALIINQSGTFGHFNLSTQMSGSKRNMEKRMERIAQKTTSWLSAVVFVIIGMAIVLLSTLPGAASGSKESAEPATIVVPDDNAPQKNLSSDWSITETEGYPAMIVDENGNIVDFIRGNLITKIYLSYGNFNGGEALPYSIMEDAFQNCVNLKTLIIDNQSNNRCYIEEIADTAFDGCPKDMVVYCEKNTDVWDYFTKKGFRVEAFNAWGDESWETLGENPAELEEIAAKGNPLYYYDSDVGPVLTKEEMRKLYGEPYFVMTESGGLLELYLSCTVQLATDIYTDEPIHFPKEATALKGTFCNDSTLRKTITIPNHITEIGNSTFQDCQIEKVEFEEGSKLEKIGECAFIQNQLSELKLPEGLKELGRNAFFWCGPLKEITIPSSVEKIDRGCFGFCEKLETVTVLNPETEFLGDPDLNDQQIFDTSVYSKKKKKMVPNTKLTIRCYKGSTAESYAKKLNLKVEYIEED